MVALYQLTYGAAVLTMAAANHDIMHHPDYVNYGAVVPGPGATRITSIAGAEEVALNDIKELEWRASDPYKA